MAKPPLRKRLLRFSLKLLGALVVGLVLVELGFRFAALHDSDLARKLGASIRHEHLFADQWQDDYWKLRTLFVPPEYREGAYAPDKHYDELLGWRSRFVLPETYEHEDAVDMGDRRPVLLYGDSFAACATPADLCWQGIFRNSDLADEYRFLNYGRTGFGFDQIYLQFIHSIDLYADEDPIVIISLLVDEDLDRSLLTLRGWPKPHFTLDADGALRLDEGPVPKGFEAYIERYPLEITSYAWRYLVYGKRMLPETWQRKVMGRQATFAEMRALNARILAEIELELAARDLEYFVILFHSKKHFGPKNKNNWREPFFIRQLQRLRMPYLSSKRRLREDQKTSHRTLKDYYIFQGEGYGHYTPLGNEVMFEMIRRGIARDYDWSP